VVEPKNGSCAIFNPVTAVFRFNDAQTAVSFVAAVVGPLEC